MIDTQKYRPKRLTVIKNKLFKGTIIFSALVGAGFTLFTVVGLTKHYIFDNPQLKAQKQEYYEALIAKEKKEKELGFKN